MAELQFWHSMLNSNVFSLFAGSCSKQNYYVGFTRLKSPGNWGSKHFNLVSVKIKRRGWPVPQTTVREPATATGNRNGPAVLRRARSAALRRRDGTRCRAPGIALRADARAASGAAARGTIRAM